MSVFNLFYFKENDFMTWCIRMCSRVLKNGYFGGGDGGGSGGGEKPVTVCTY